jgi:hypothetical protein
LLKAIGRIRIVDGELLGARFDRFCQGLLKPT